MTEPKRRRDRRRLSVEFKREAVVLFKVLVFPQNR